MTEAVERAVLLDMDGVVTNGLPYHKHAWQQAFREVLGVEIPDLWIFTTEGAKEQHIIVDFARRFGLTPSEEEQERVYRRKTEVFDQVFHLDAMPGIEDSLRLMRSLGYRLGLVTGARRAVAERVLTELGVRGWFDDVTGCDELSAGKPSPEPYLVGARGVGVAPDRALVIENAPYGIQAARAAGMACVALETSLPREHLAGANAILDGHAALQELLRGEFERSGGRGPWLVG